MSQFYQLTVEDAIADYQEGASTAYGLVKNYIRIKFKEGWKIFINLKKVSAELGLTISTLYRALKKIKKVFSDRHIIIRSEKTFCEPENNFRRSAKTSCTSENENPQTTSKTNTEGDPPDLRSDLDHISLSDKQKPKIDRVGQLPEEEREKFLNFAMDGVNQLPNRPSLPSKWIKNNFEELYSEFKLSSAPETQKATEDRQFAEWYDLMKQLGHVTGQRKEGGKQLVQKFGSDYWIEYEKMAQRWTLDYLRKCVNGR